MSTTYNEIAWFHSVEKMMGLALTPRCKYVRVIMGELGRLTDHLLCVGAAALDLGALTAFLYGFYQRELIYGIFEQVSGQRFHPSYLRVGCLLFHIGDDTIRLIAAFVKQFPT